MVSKRKLSKKNKKIYGSAYDDEVFEQADYEREYDDDYDFDPYDINDDLEQTDYEKDYDYDVEEYDKDENLEKDDYDYLDNVDNLKSVNIKEDKKMENINYDMFLIKKRFENIKKNIEKYMFAYDETDKNILKSAVDNLEKYMDNVKDEKDIFYIELKLELLVIMIYKIRLGLNTVNELKKIVRDYKKTYCHYKLKDFKDKNDIKKLKIYNKKNCDPFKIESNKKALATQSKKIINKEKYKINKKLKKL